MKNEELFQKTTQKLVNAFLSGELEKAHCRSCAVGQICSGWDKWKDIFCSEERYPGFTYQIKNELVDLDTGQSLNEELTVLMEACKIKSGGYTALELSKIEYAFEANTKIPWFEYKEHSEKEVWEDQLKGLQAVIDILFEIHAVNFDTRDSFRVKKELELVYES